MLLLIDNYDSFAYNLVHYLGELGAEVVVRRNDEIDVQSAMALRPEAILLSPVDLYSQVNRSVKYGFLFIGFTFMAFLMFDVIAGVRVSTVEYLLVGAGLVLFFVMLLAFAALLGLFFYARRRRERLRATYRHAHVRRPHRARKRDHP